MATTCDNKSVGLIIEDERGRMAVIFKRNYPKSYAFIAGHVDGIDVKEAARKETLEEGGLTLGRFVEVFHENLSNPCKRSGGTRHNWTVYETYDWDGEFRASSDAKEARWMEPQEFKKIVARTEYFMKKLAVRWDNIDELTRAIFGDPATPRTDPEWEQDPGLEPVWYYILKRLGKI